MKCKVEGCDNEKTVGRRYCRECYLRIKRERSKLQYCRNGQYMYKVVCKVCNTDFESCRKTTLYCKDCWKRILTFAYRGINPYVSSGGGGYWWEHRRIAEQVLKLSLDKDTVVHHCDLNPTNNTLSNLLVLSRRNHVRLHSALHHVIAEAMRDNDEDRLTPEFIAKWTMSWVEANPCLIIPLTSEEGVGKLLADTPIDLPESRDTIRVLL